ncbi:MAG: LytR/AlgR family response regulator transcription factor [Flavobacteriales bacterium]|jgi:DNA-binding LytR/AlgR family response regulator
MSIRVFILEDDGTVRTQLRAFVHRTPGLELVGESGDALEAGAFISHHRVDLVFLDIGLPVLDGYAFLRALDRPPLVIVVSGHAAHAAQAFEHSAVDFLLKPFSYDRFLKAVSRTRSQHLAPGTSSPRIEQPKIPDRSLQLRCGHDTLQVPIGTIELVQSMGNYVKVYTRDDAHLLATNTMSNMEASLPGEHFVRIHRSYIIAIDAVLAVTSRSVEWRKGELPLGGNYKRNAMSTLAGRA